MKLESVPSLKGKRAVRFGIYMAAYVVSIIWMAWVREDMQDDPLLLAIIAVPAICVFLAIRESYLSIMAMDELIRRIHLESILISACLTGGITFVWGLYTNAGLPDMETTLVLPMLMGFWGLSTIVRKRAYE